MPADRVEGAILGVIKDDLAQLRDNEQLHEYIAQEMKRLTGERGNTHGQLQHRLEEVGQQLGRLREHLQLLDHETAKVLGLYDEAATLATERKEIEKQLEESHGALPQLPPAEMIRLNAAKAFDSLDEVLGMATIEERRELMRKYLRAARVDPNSRTVQVSLYTALFNQMVAGAA